MKELKTTRGETMLVDDEDYENAKQYKWRVDCANGRRQVNVASGKGSLSYKKLILGLGGKITLHKNDNPLDLRKENIMVFDTRSEFSKVCVRLHKRKNKFYPKVSLAIQRSNRKSVKKYNYIGVYYEKKYQRPWVSSITYNTQKYYLGNYMKEEYAALAYDQKALELYGPESKRNFPHLTLEEIKENLAQIKAEDAIIFYDHKSKKIQGLIREGIYKTSQYVGVSYDKRARKAWRAYINQHRKNHYIGNYYTEEAAARAYDEKALERYGENAKLNFPR